MRLPPCSISVITVFILFTLVIPTAIACGDPADNCAACDSYGWCTKCYNSDWSLYAGQCVYCPPAFGNMWMGSCYVCPPGYTFVQGGCYACAAGYYLIKSPLSCGKCDVSCSTCSGPGPYACKSCSYYYPGCFIDNGSTNTASQSLSVTSSTSLSTSLSASVSLSVSLTSSTSISSSITPSEGASPSSTPPVSVTPTPTSTYIPSDTPSVTSSPVMGLNAQPAVVYVYNNKANFAAIGVATASTVLLAGVLIGVGVYAWKRRSGVVGPAVLVTNLDDGLHHNPVNANAITTVMTVSNMPAWNAALAQNNRVRTLHAPQHPRQPSTHTLSPESVFESKPGAQRNANARADAYVPRQGNGVVLSPLSQPLKPIPPTVRSHNTATPTTITVASPTCVVCLSEPPEFAVYPCGHKAFCVDCAHGFMQQQHNNRGNGSSNKLCPTCRGPVKDILRIYDA